MTRPQTVDQAATIAHDTVLAYADDTTLADFIRRGVLDAYRVGHNRALEQAAVALEAHSVAEWELRIVRSLKDAS